MMMKTKNKYSWLLILSVLLSACNSFLGVDQKGHIIPKYIEDYDQMLNDLQGSVLNPLFMSPEVDQTETAFLQASMSDRRGYIWDDFQFLTGENDPDWNSLYSRIAVCNEIIEHVDEAESTTRNEVLRAVVKAQAYADRAKCYFALVNSYGKPYSPQNKATLGVPLVLKNDILQVSERATVEDVYDKICKDLNVAVISAPRTVNIKANNRASLQAVWAFKSKVFLFMNQIDSAYNCIEKAFAISEPELYKYEEMYDPSQENVWNANLLPRNYYEYKEIIWYGGLVSNLWGMRVFYTDELKALYDLKNDYRYLMFASDLDNGTLKPYDKTRYYSRVSRTFAVSAAEMYLLRAECHARKGDIEGAMSALETLRISRFTSGYDCRLSASSQKDAIERVKEERLRELAFTGMHWFDLRRYQAYGESVPTYTRTIEGKTYTLEPGSNRYTLSIARYVIGKNPSIEQNPR